MQIFNVALLFTKQDQRSATPRVVETGTTPTEWTWAERVYHFVTLVISPLLASGHVSQSDGLWLAGIFLISLFLAAWSYAAQRQSRNPNHQLYQ